MNTECSFGFHPGARLRDARAVQGLDNDRQVLGGTIGLTLHYGIFISEDIWATDIRISVQFRSWALSASLE